MQMFLPLFPLNLVVFPGEALNLHIFETRYRQLVNECYQDHTTFGIPTYIDEQIGQFGTEVELLAIENLYPDGRMDIKTRGLRIFELLDFQNPAPEKLYAGGEVLLLEEDPQRANPATTEYLERMLESLSQVLQIKVLEQADPNRPLSYQIAHRMGLSLSQKYELLQIASEELRQQRLIKHLDQSLPILREAERSKMIVKMNGHFKHFDPLSF